VPKLSVGIRRRVEFRRNVAVVAFSLALKPRCNVAVLLRFRRSIAEEAPKEARVAIDSDAFAIE
jgi:hypothetical protein